MSKREIGQEILDDIREIKTHKAGKKKLKSYELSEPSSPQVICMIHIYSFNFRRAKSI